MHTTLYYYYRDITPYLEEQIKDYYIKKGYTVYTCFLWYQEHENKFYFDLEIGNGKLDNYRHIENYYSYKELDNKYNFVLSEY